MSDEVTSLERIAKDLAARSYVVKYKDESLSDGSTTYMAYHPELPGCQSDGKTREEARKNLEDARFVYIYYLLVDGQDVPLPRHCNRFELEEKVHSKSTSPLIQLSSDFNKRDNQRNVLEPVLATTLPY